MSCRLILNLRSMSSRGDNSSGNNKSGSEAPGSHNPPPPSLPHRVNTRESPPNSSRREKEIPLLPVTFDIGPEYKPPTPPSNARSHVGLTPYSAVPPPMPPPWQQHGNPMQQYPRPPPRPAGMTNAPDHLTSRFY